MRAGRLRTLAELQRKVETRTSGSGTETRWVRERDVWCEIGGLSPSLRVEAMAREPKLTHEITARQEGDIDATKRLVVGARAFMIAGIPDDVEERGREVKFLAVEGVAT